MGVVDVAVGGSAHYHNIVPPSIVGESAAFGQGVEYAEPLGARGDCLWFLYLAHHHNPVAG